MYVPVPQIMMSVDSQISIVCLANYYGRTKCVVENEIEI